jgi:hypothetical protein
VKNPGRWLLAVLSVAAAAATFIGVSSVVTKQTGYWLAEATAAVLPANSDPTYDAIYYETLSNGQLVLTLAEVVRSAPAEAIGATVDVRVVPETSILVIEAQSTTRESAELAVANKLVAGTSSISVLQIPYRLNVLANGTGTASFVQPSGLARLIVAGGAAAAVFLVLAAGVPWVRRQLRR